jgi:hypothetical protein
VESLNIKDLVDEVAELEALDDEQDVASKVILDHLHQYISEALPADRL